MQNLTCWAAEIESATTRRAPQGRAHWCILWLWRACCAGLPI